MKNKSRGVFFAVSAVVGIVAACGGKTAAYSDPATPHGTSDAGSFSYSPSGSASSTPGATSDQPYTVSFPGCNTPAPTCDYVFPAPDSFTSAQDVANALVGAWIRCNDPDSQQPHFSAGDASIGSSVGDEFTADGHYYDLVIDANGDFVRDENPERFGTWAVQISDSDAHLIQLVISRSDGSTLTNDIGLSTCPRAYINADIPYMPIP